MNKTIRTVSSIAIVSLICKIFGAGRELSLAYCFGSSGLTDAYLLATTIPVTIFSFIYESIAASFIPAISRINERNGQAVFTSNVINTTLLFTLGVVVLIEIFPDFVIRLFAAGFGDDTIKLSSYILRISVLGVFFTALSNIIVAYLNFNNSFLIATARAIPLDIIVILSIFLAYYYDSVIILAIGIPISMIISALFLIPETKRLGFKYSFSLDFKDENIQNLIIWSIPVIISTALFDINSIVDRQFSSYLCVGGISIITYSTRLINIFTSLLILPVLTFIFPNFTRSIQDGKNEEANDLYIIVLRNMILITVPIVFVVIGLSPEIVTIIFKRGAFTEHDVLLSSQCLIYYSPTIIAFAISSMATRFFYADTDMWTPLKISSCGVIINIIGDFIFSKYIGLRGLAFASSISLLFTAIVQHVVLCKQRRIETKGVRSFVLTILLSSVLGMPILFFKNFLENVIGVFGGTIILVIAYSIIYIMIVKMLGITEIDNYLKIIKIKK